MWTGTPSDAGGLSSLTGTPSDTGSLSAVTGAPSDMARVPSTLTGTTEGARAGRWGSWVLSRPLPSRSCLQGPTLLMIEAGSGRVRR